MVPLRREFCLAAMVLLLGSPSKELREAVSPKGVTPVTVTWGVPSVATVPCERLASLLESPGASPPEGCT